MVPPLNTDEKPDARRSMHARRARSRFRVEAPLPARAAAAVGFPQLPAQSDRASRSVSVTSGHGRRSGALGAMAQPGPSGQAPEAMDVDTPHPPRPPHTPGDWKAVMRLDDVTHQWRLLAFRRDCQDERRPHVGEPGRPKQLEEDDVGPTDERDDLPAFDGQIPPLVHGAFVGAHRCLPYAMAVMEAEMTSIGIEGGEVELRGHELGIEQFSPSALRRSFCYLPDAAFDRNTLTVLFGYPPMMMNVTVDVSTREQHARSYYFKAWCSP